MQIGTDTKISPGSGGNVDQTMVLITFKISRLRQVTRPCTAPARDPLKPHCGRWTRPAHAMPDCHVPPS